MKEIKPPVKAAKIETSFRNPPKNSGPVIKKYGKGAGKI
jgi:hypothetical protein